MQSIIIRHNVEMAHRLSQQPDSKCHNIHGHSWWVEAEIIGKPDKHGMILDFATVKKAFRGYLDSTFDHHCCLNWQDDWCEATSLASDSNLPGLVTIPCDPTVENMARIWGEWLQEAFTNEFDYKVKVWEASSNAATWASFEVPRYT